MHDIAVKSGTNEDRGDRGVCVVPNRLDFIKVFLHSKNREESNSMVHIHPEENGEDDKKPKSVPVPCSHQGYRKTMDEPTLMIPICHYAPKAFVITGDIAPKPPHLTMEHDLGPGKISTNPFVIHPCRFDAEPAGSWTLMGNGQRCKVSTWNGGSISAAQQTELLIQLDGVQRRKSRRRNESKGHRRQYGRKANCWLGNATGITITILNHAITSTSGLTEQFLAEVSRLKLIAEFSSTHSTADSLQVPDEEEEVSDPGDTGMEIHARLALTTICLLRGLSCRMLLTHQDNVDSKEGFETEGNLVAFARHIYAWFDRGVWSLKLPDGFNDKELFPKTVELDDEEYNSARLIWAALERAHQTHFLPRAPLKGFTDTGSASKVIFHDLRAKLVDTAATGSHEWCRWVPGPAFMSGAADFPGPLPSDEEFDSITKRNLVATQATTKQSRPLPVAQHSHPWINDLVQKPSEYRLKHEDKRMTNDSEVVFQFHWLHRRREKPDDGTSPQQHDKGRSRFGSGKRTRSSKHITSEAIISKTTRC
ncbi:hypothetical protein FGSG_09160 [Fusarium graminearum PH-1]|uniref:hypothetical protein n=1 Tax=Gibberella zeae (strain ATCC MYA-4620 / CBS 123657 / FGSC 9075 / NRRL 31084 / PH-1) TaxID=229533 RepID=UPI000023E2E5|nr:hypothetical protein FGSG_09160 [Fusarium graminearum PH-1]ESU15692.1 hypothetical protein FGSG_09160 [Fusarium graminearum PH-1]|eukprot:XP_011328624.1 hypothetical protein FGSG_09160 [Fusarium graminearum PH-1]